MRFERVKRNSIAIPGSTEVLYTCGEFKIMAHALGIQMFGDSDVITSNSELEGLAKALGDAMKDYLALRKENRNKILSN